MKPTVYTVHAYRWGDRENHSYTVGVYSKKHAALKAAEAEESWRGGKYECEVVQWTLDEGAHADSSHMGKVVKALPAGNTLQKRANWSPNAALRGADRDTAENKATPGSASP